MVVSTHDVNALRVASRRQELLGTLTGRVEEACSGRAVLEAFGREPQSLEEIRQASCELAELYRSQFA